MRHAIGCAGTSSAMDPGSRREALKTKARAAERDTHAHGALVGGTATAGHRIGAIIIVSSLEKRILRADNALENEWFVHSRRS
ncbi:MAG: hypothetical protein WCJ35_18235 [Planctomycetota bacterium]